MPSRIRLIAAGLSALACFSGSVARADVQRLDDYDHWRDFTHVAITQLENVTGDGGVLEPRFLVAARGSNNNRLNIMGFSVAGDDITALGHNVPFKIDEVALASRRINGYYVIATKMEASGDLRLDSYRLKQNGSLQFEDAAQKGEAFNVSIAPVAVDPSDLSPSWEDRFVTVHKKANDRVVLNCWRMDDNGNIHHEAENDSDGGYASTVEVSARELGSYVQIHTVKRKNDGDLIVINWAWNPTTNTLSRTGDSVESGYPGESIQKLASGKSWKFPPIAGRNGSGNLTLQRWSASGVGCNGGGGGCNVQRSANGAFGSVSTNSNLCVEGWNANGAITAMRDGLGDLTVTSWYECMFLGWCTDGSDWAASGSGSVKKIALGFDGRGNRAVTATRFGAGDMILHLWSITDYELVAGSSPADELDAGSADGPREVFGSTPNAGGSVGTGLTSGLLLRMDGPNPLRSGETARFQLRLGEPTNVTVGVFDPSGRLVRSILSRPLGAGEHALSWDGQDRSGRSVSSGLFLVRAIAGTQEKTVKIVYR